MPPKLTISSICRRINQLDLDENAAKSLANEVNEIIDSSSSQLNQEVREQISQVNAYYEQLRCSIPPEYRKMKIGDIKSAGGSLEVNSNGDYIIKIPQKASTSSRTTPLKSVVSAKLSQSIRRSKRKREGIEPVTPSQPVFKASKQISSTRVVKKKPTVTSGTIKKTQSESKHVEEVLAKNEPEATFDEIVIKNTINESSTPPFRMTLVNPKTPQGKHRLFKKEPRKVNDGEHIVHCSAAGTPLLIPNNDEKNKSKTCTNT